MQILRLIGSILAGGLAIYLFIQHNFGPANFLLTTSLANYIIFEFEEMRNDAKKRP